jgi:hypothetical protein
VEAFKMPQKNNVLFSTLTEIFLKGVKNFSNQTALLEHPREKIYVADIKGNKTCIQINPMVHSV